MMVSKTPLDISNEHYAFLDGKHEALLCPTEDWVSIFSGYNTTKDLVTAYERGVRTRFKSYKCSVYITNIVMPMNGKLKKAKPLNEIFKRIP